MTSDDRPRPEVRDPTEGNPTGSDYCADSPSWKHHRENRVCIFCQHGEYYDLKAGGE